MNCQEFQNEFESVDLLTRAARQHSKNCADCRDFQTSQSRVSAILQGLPRVEAPKDFDFQVRARIARQNEENQRIPFFLSFRHILPFASVLLIVSAVAIGGLFIIRNGGNDRVDSSSAARPQDPQIQPAKEISAMPQPANSFTESNASVNAPAPEADLETRKMPVRQKRPASSSEKNVDEGGGSRDLAVTSVPPVIQPEFNTNRPIEVVPNPNRTTISSLSEVLKISGIDAEDGKVISVAKNSLAERSGIRVGDSILAVNGRKIDSGEFSGNQISIRTITIIRNGESVDIVLKN